MDRKAFDALVNKGRITHVGVAADCDVLNDGEMTARHMTHHEAVAEVLAGTEEAPVETPTEPATPVIPEEPVAPEESVVPETPVEEPTKAPAKKSKKNSAAPSVDPVE